MFEVSVTAQQCIVDALKDCEDLSQAIILCHTPSEVCADEKFSLGTHDLLDDFLGKDSISLISIFPNIGIVKQALKECKDLSFMIDCIFACHHTHDPLDVSIEVVSRLGLDFQNVSQVAFIADMPKGTYRSYATTAYRIRVQSDVCSKISISWKKQHDQFDEFLIRKFLASHDEVMNIINNLDGPLKRHTSKRNSLFDFEGGRNYDAYSFKPGKGGLKVYKEEIEQLKNVCRSLCKDLPSATFQFRERVNWRWLSQDGSIEATILFCRNLDHHKLLQVASFLTSCAISFRFCSVNAIVINTAGLDSSILVRLMHYAEVPIPTTVKQGAFSLCIKGNGFAASDRNFLTFDLKVGRIGSLPSVPLQIRCTSIEEFYSVPYHQSSIGRWIKRELSGFNISEVVCVDEDQVTDSFLQFRVPIEDEANYPKVFKYKGKTFSVDHALPYATHFGMRARPPQEETVHEHWKKAARLAPQEKISHANCIAKAENCPRSLQRVMRLRESSIKDSASTISMYVEQTKLPWCFFTSCVSQQTAIDCFCKCGIDHLEDKEDIEAVLTASDGAGNFPRGYSDDSATVHVIRICCKDDQPVRIGLFYEGKYGWTVSTAELVQCHAYTPCMLVIMVPPGCKLTDICSPSRHFTTLQVFTLPRPKKNQKEVRYKVDSQLTQISPNHTAPAASPDSGEELTHQYRGEVKPGADAISPTVPWTEQGSEQVSRQEEDRQMPLLRRSSDQATHKSEKVLSQACPRPKEVKSPKKIDISQPGYCDTDKSDQIKRYEENKQSDQQNKGDTCGASTSPQRKVVQDHSDSGPDKKLRSQRVQGNGNELSKEELRETKNGVDRNSRATPLHKPSQHDPKLHRSYLVCEDKSDLLDNDLQVGIEFAPLDSESTVHQQCIAIPSKIPSLSVHGAHAEDAEMKDVRHHSESRKRGVKKDLVSKSCPPSLRTASPRISLDQKGPSERNQRLTQRVTLSKIRDSSQAGRSRNKDTGGEDVATSEAIQKQIGHADNLMKPQHTHSQHRTM